MLHALALNGCYISGNARHIWQNTYPQPQMIKGLQPNHRPLDTVDTSSCPQVRLIIGELGTVLNDTRANVEKKQALTYEELLAEAAEAEVDAGPSDSDEEDEFVYNPLKLPLGYDGKPIPYWLYKLHGLNQVRPQFMSI